MMTANIRTIIGKAQTALEPYSDSPRLDAEILLAHVLHCNSASLIAKHRDPITQTQYQQFRELLAKRRQSIPVAYLVGEKEFWSLPLTVTQDTLIPRSETELLVELVLQQLDSTAKCQILDLGTGSGAIALALGIERPHWQIHATDLSASALAVAQANAKKLAIHNVAFFQGDWLSAVPPQQYSAIISNPPYISNTDPAAASCPALHFEPERALFAEDNGLAAFNQITPLAKKFLINNGLIAFEHGHTQAAALRQLFSDQGYHDIHTQPDLANLDRVTSARCKK